MSEKEILDILQNWSEEFGVANFGISLVRRAAFALAKGIAHLIAGLEDAAKSLYNLLPTLIAESKIGELISDFKPLLVVLLTLSIMATGYIIMFKKDGKSNLLQNFMILFLVFSVMPLTAGKVADLTMGASAGVFNVMEGESAAAYDIIENNVTDLYMLMEEERITKSETERARVLKADTNAFSANRKSISLVKISAQLDYDEEDFGDYQKLTQREIDIDAMGKPYLKKLNGGVFDVTHSYYYRYSINWLALLVSLLAMFVTLLLTCVRLAKMIWEIILNLIFAPFVAVTDLASGQRIKELLRNLLSLFAIMGLISVILGAYNLCMKLLSYLFQTDAINSFLYLLLLIGLASITIEGPSILQRIYGIDAGGRGPLGMLQSVYYGVRLGKDVGRASAKTAALGASLAKSSMKQGAKAVQNGKDKAKSHLKSASPVENDAKNMGAKAEEKANGNEKTEVNLSAKNQRSHLGGNKVSADKTNLSQNHKEESRNQAKTEVRAPRANAGKDSLAASAAKNSGREKSLGLNASNKIGMKKPGVSDLSQKSRANITAKSPKLSGGRMTANTKTLQGNLRSKSLHPKAEPKTTYQTTDNRIIKSLREKNGIETNPAAGKQSAAQAKKFGQRKGLK